jgi:hypothetical protein
MKRIIYGILFPALIAVNYSCSSLNELSGMLTNHDSPPFHSLTVYTAGHYAADPMNYYACYWTGTKRTDLLPVSVEEGTAYSIAVSGGTVYTAGYYNDGPKNIACYWTGTNRTILPGDGTHSACASSIAVSGGVVYTAGYYNDGSKNAACCWIGTILTN